MLEIQEVGYQMERRVFCRRRLRISLYHDGSRPEIPDYHFVHRRYVGSPNPDGILSFTEVRLQDGKVVNAAFGPLP